MLSCVRGYYGLVLTTFPSKRKEVTEEPIIVICHLKLVMKDIKGKKQSMLFLVKHTLTLPTIQKRFFYFFFMPTRLLLFGTAGCVLRQPKAFVHCA